MRLTIAVPLMNQLQDSKGILALLKYISSDDVEFIFIDNGSTDKYEDFILHYLRPKRMQYIRNKENVGLVRSMQIAYENCNTEILAITHNDVLVYEKDWDKRVASYFEKMPDVGAAGFFGSQGCGPIGERIQDVPHSGVMAGMSNMLEAEIHGFRMHEEWKPAAIFDGLMMIFRMEMLKKGGGFDQQYKYHHIYDRDASLESLKRGYKNIVINVPCHHLSGLTANRSDYQNWAREKFPDKKHDQTFNADKFIHDENSLLFKEKFKDVLPLYVNDDFSFRNEQQGQWNFKGDAIKKMK